MKKDIQPQYEETTITCACGKVYKVGSTKKDLKVDICSNCHAFWTGNLKEKQLEEEQIDLRKNTESNNKKRAKALSLFITLGKIWKNVGNSN